jgi:hypothetical protein
MLNFQIQYIVISDFRALPWVAAMNIVRRFSRKRKIVFIVSSRFLYSEDYGAHLPSIYKKLKLKFIELFYELVCVNARTDSTLSDVEFRGVSSSLQSITCDSKASEMTYPILFKMLCESALGAKEIFQYISRSNVIAKVFIFNGRTASSYPVARGCFDHGINVVYYEYGSTPFSGYRLYPYPPHSTIRLGMDIANFRKICLTSIPNLYHRGRIWGQAKLTNEFTKNYLDANKLNYDIVVFLGSDHEYNCLDEDLSGFRFVGNLGLVKAVIEKYGKKKSIAVRAHPNQAKDINFNHTLSSVIDLCSNFGVTFFGPDSKVSSYELIKNSSIVAVDLSSIAYDAVLLKKQVDAFGDLDLKEILLHIPESKMFDRDFIAEHVREVMCLYEDLFVIKFNCFEKLICRAFSFFEFYVLRAATPPKILTKHNPDLQFQNCNNG